MGLRDIESTLPPGFRFYPSDEELICHYLYKKVANVKAYEGTMVEVDLHTREPWELPDVAKLSDNEWYFFSFRDRKYATGSRANRATKSGYWKATGKDRTIYHPDTHEIVGMRKTLVFYGGRAPNGLKTVWVMHEFRLQNPHTPSKEDWVLCRVFNKRKGEMGRSSSVENLESSPPLADHQSIMQEGSFSVPLQEGNGSNTFLNLALLHFDFLDSTGMMGMETGMGSTGTKDGGADDYGGFLVDVEPDDDHGNGSQGITDVDIRY